MKQLNALKVIFMLLLSLIIHGCEKDEDNKDEENANYTEYQSISETNKQMFYTEDFISGSDIWPLIPFDNWFGATFQDGGYYFKNLNSTGKHISTTIDDFSQHDFEIELNFKRFKTNSGNNNCGFTWGGNNDGYYYIQLSGYKSDVTSPTLYFGKYLGTDKSWYKENQKSINEVPNSNKVTIRRISDKYYLFLNELFIAEHSFEGFLGKKLGIMIGGNGEALVENISISLLQTL